MPTPNAIPAVRRWQRLGKTILDMRHVVKIEFGRGEARLFAVAGEALLLVAWTESRGEVADLKQLAAHANRWVSVTEDARLPEGIDLGSAGDAESGSEASSNGDYSVGDDYEAERVTAPAAPDHRVRLASVDRLVTVDTASGDAVELFASGVFLGRVVSPDDLEEIEAYVGQ